MVEPVGVDLEHAGQPPVQLDHAPAEVEDHLSRALIHRDDDHLGRPLAIGEQVVQPQAGGQEALAVLAGDGDQTLSGAGIAVVQPADDGLLPVAEPDRLLGRVALAALGQPAVALDEGDHPVATGRREALEVQRSPGRGRLRPGSHGGLGGV
jgi:hypothetical protein